MKFLILNLVLLITSSTFAADPVKPGPTSYWSSGAFIARPIRSADSKGVVLRTIEFEVSYGSVDENSKFLGKNIGISSKSPQIYEKFKKLDMNKAYVFKYEYPYPLNPVTNSSHFLITAIEDLKKSDDKMPTRIVGDTDRQGSYNPNAELNGVLVEVERWGITSTTCTLTIHTGGSKSESNHPFVGMVIYGEKNCAQSEALLPYAREVKVKYNQDYIEIWEGSSRIVQTIDILETVENVKSGIAQAPSIEELGRRLLNNPEFVRQLDQRLREMRERQVAK